MQVYIATHNLCNTPFEAGAPHQKASAQLTRRETRLLSWGWGGEGPVGGLGLWLVNARARRAGVRTRNMSVHAARKNLHAALLYLSPSLVAADGRRQTGPLYSVLLC